MSLYRSLSIATAMLAFTAACSDDTAEPTATDSGADASSGDEDAGPSGSKTVLDLADVAESPEKYEWFDFRPNLKKLILAGAAETEHIAILWYMVDDGGVALHYHAKTESVYVIDGTQTDAKGTYETGTVYFNPPGSGHEVTDSSGFFLLAYAAPPDFMGTDMIEAYTPIEIDTEAEGLTSELAFEELAEGIQTFAPDLDAMGGMSAELIETSATEAYEYDGNYVLVLSGECLVDGEELGEDMLAVTGGVTPEAFSIAAPTAATCLALAVSF